MSRTATLRHTLFATLVTIGSFLLLQACGGGGGGGAPGPSTYQMGGARQGVALRVTTNSAVTRLAGTIAVPGTTDGTGTTAQFNLPQGITTDGTSLYVADTNNHTIRRIVIATGATTTLAGAAGTSGRIDSTDGTGATARFNLPQGITTDGTSLYVADTNNSNIRRIVIATGATNRLADAAEFSRPQGITTDGRSLLFSATDDHRLLAMR